MEKPTQTYFRYLMVMKVLAALLGALIGSGTMYLAVRDRLSTGETHLGKPDVPGMWAINGTASVVGSALAILIAMSVRYSWSLIFGAGVYLTAALAIQFVRGQSRLFEDSNR